MNRLAQSHSPYLLQHKNNPVDWYPWGDEAFAAAKQRDVPIFLSIGYAACHWCHVMEHESFENEALAAKLNEHFVSIKVDREERPDIDSIYMNAVQIMTGSGGWPMSVFLDHDRKPFYAGTYFPPKSRMGMPGFVDVIESLAAAWRDRRGEVTKHADQITEAIRSLGEQSSDQDPSQPDRRVLQSATDRLIAAADMVEGGFGGAPKFPHATDLRWLIRCLRRATVDPDTLSEAKIHITDQAGAVVRTTLDAMAAGGIRDHIGGGFSRYSVDSKWLVPHFEKMLYDNALLAKTYLHAYQQSGHEGDREVATETLDYIVGELTDESGGFHCSEDADSEGVEGKYYVWSPAEVIDILGQERGQRFCQIYDITSRGNFEGHSIANLIRPLESYAADASIDVETLKQELTDDKRQLLETRLQRIRPGRDDKIIVAWNALAIDALAEAGAMLDRRDYIDAATRAAAFVRDQMTEDGGRLKHAFRRGHAHIEAMADDYTHMIMALVSVYTATADVQWIDIARTYADQLLTHFQDDDAGGFYYTRDDSETLLTREKEWHDASLISSNAAAAIGLWHLGSICHEVRYLQAARRTVAAGAHVLQTQSMAAGGLVIAADVVATNSRQTVLAVPSQDSLAKYRGRFVRERSPDTVLAWQIDGQAAVPIAERKGTIDGQPTLYVCKDFTCDAPVTIE